ncbi:MAG TPA: hypothetical protein VFK03_03690, partial [Candidatus Saccharimonadales bacterium]|nr:hypothetical protein [Candidatus Saccharimonadales bacterium]
MTEGQQTPPPAPNRPSWRHRLGWLVAGLAVFYLGILVGQGRLSFSFSASPPSSLNASLPADLDYSSVETVYDALKTNYAGKLTTGQLLEGLKSGLAEAAHDP